TRSLLLYIAEIHVRVFYIFRATDWISFAVKEYSIVNRKAEPLLPSFGSPPVVDKYDPQSPNVIHQLPECPDCGFLIRHESFLLQVLSHLGDVGDTEVEA